MIKKIFLDIHPFLFILVSLLFIYFQTIWETVPTEIIRPFLILSVVVLLFYPLMIKLVGSREWGGILMTVFVIILFYQASYFIIVSISLVLVILVLYLYYRFSGYRFLVTQISMSLSLAGIIFVFFELAVFFFILKSLPLSYFSAMSARTGTDMMSLSNPNSKPDIYFIILDAYPRTDILQELYRFDNTEFLGYLEQLGFTIPSNIRANYPRTALSVSSTLDMQYWDTISPGMQDVVIWWPTKPVIRFSRVRESLEAIGYKSVTFASDWDLTDNPTADIYFKPYPYRLSGYENFIAVTTPIRSFMPVFQSVAPIMSNAVHRRYVLNILENLKQIPDIEGPKFVFAHILIPHPPFVFNADGSPIESSEEFTFAPRLSHEEERDGYIAHIEFLNGQLRMIVDAILRNSETPPIIILQADHGSGLYYSFTEPEKSCLKERFSIFGAYYLPGKPEDIIPENITPVNLFRIIFNEYFGAQMPLLENRHYVTINHNLFAGMKDVTGTIENFCELPQN